MKPNDLRETARAMVAPGKGILAMDESNPTCDKRFAGIGVEANESTRRRYRGMLVATPGLGESVAAAILFDETLRGDTPDGEPFAARLDAAGVIPGIKVDAGAKPLAGHDGEKVTEGLDGLRERLAAYRELGARFAKWRAVITIGNGLPSRACIDANAHALARYAALCQEAGIVPIVEPEVLMDGGHDIERCEEATRAAQSAVFEQLDIQGVAPEGMVLKPNMVVSGATCASQADAAEVAERTVRCLLDTTPAPVPGIAFLSGGLGDAQATEFLNAINLEGARVGAPWRLTFSFGRALQQPALKAWAGNDANNARAQTALAHRAAMNGAACGGRYTPDMERAA